MTEMLSEPNKLTASRFILTNIYLLVYPASIILLGGDWQWIEGWIFNIWVIVFFVSTTVYMYRKDPALLAERFRKPGTGNDKGWDKYLLYGLFILFIGWFIIMPLDARRFQWTPDFPIWLKAIGAIMGSISIFFLYRAFTDNTFLSPLVRMQTERRQEVVSKGVYGIVRHPMYLGAGLTYLGAPLFLNSKYGFLIGLSMIILLMIRIIGEEQMLVNELEGYADYQKKVRYRLIPFIW